MQNTTFDVNKKNRVKRVRVFVQILVLLALVAVIIKPLAFPDRYKPYAPATDAYVAGQGQDGFVALGFFEVAEAGAGPARSLPSDRLDSYLKALKASGYNTITQDDIIAYYTSGQPLPPKALFLMFEDGRKDTTTLAHRVLQPLNYKASAFTYADQLVNTDPIFLGEAELEKLVQSSYWETGSNGYRLSYINALDRYGNFLGQLNSNEYLRVRQYLGRGYDHYLMDFIRDEDDVPTETTPELAQRIQDDYTLMRDIYTEKSGQVPKAYALMHANSGKFGTHDRASEQNEASMMEIFKLNFNREGFSYNNRESSIYDLTRMQPQAFWYTNHLLMRIHAETGQEVQFVQGDGRRAQAFVAVQGQPEYRGSQIALTSEAEGRGLLRLKDNLPADLDVSVQLTGNTEGMQAIRLRSDEAGTSYVQVSLENNHLLVHRAMGGQLTELFKLDLRELDRPPVISKAEDEHEGLKAYYQAVMQFNKDPQRVEAASNVLKELETKPVLTVAQGAEPYIPAIDARQQGDRHLRIVLTGDTLELQVDGKVAGKDIDAGGPDGAFLWLESRPLLPEVNQRNVYDPVYDGVFQNLVVRDASTDSRPILFDNNLNAWERVTTGVSDAFGRVVDWFVNNL